MGLGMGTPVEGLTLAKQVEEALMRRCSTCGAEANWVERGWAHQQALSNGGVVEDWACNSHAGPYHRLALHQGDNIIRLVPYPKAQL